MLRKQLFFQTSRRLSRLVMTAIATAVLVSACDVPWINSPDSDTATNERTLIESTNERSAKFVQGTQPVTGNAQLLEENGAFYLQFDPAFNVPTYEEAQVLLIPEATPPVSYTDLAENSVNLGPLAAARGLQRYPIPAGTDVDGFQAVVILSPDTAVALGYAAFESNTGTVIESISPVETIEAANVLTPVAPLNSDIPVATIQSINPNQPTETAQTPVSPQPSETAPSPAVTAAEPTTELPVETAQAPAPNESAAPSVEMAQANEEAEPDATVSAPRALW